MNRVMATRSVSLHDEHAAATRSRILDAVVDLIVKEHPATLSMPAVAARAGVSLRTVYRYFPTKEALIDAIGEIGSPEETLRNFPPDALRLANLRDYLRSLWTELEPTRTLMKAQKATPLGEEISKQRAKRRKPVIERVLADEGVQLDPDDHDRLVAMVSMLVSRTTLFELTDVMGLTADEAARLSVWTIHAILDEAQRTKEVGR